MCTQDFSSISRDSTDSGDARAYHPGEVWAFDINTLEGFDEETHAISFGRSQGNSLLPAAGLQEYTTQEGAGVGADAAGADAASAADDIMSLGWYSANDNEDDDLMFDNTSDHFDSSHSDGAVPVIPRWSIAYLREAINSVAGGNLSPPVLSAAVFGLVCTIHACLKQEASTSREFETVVSMRLARVK